MYRIGIDIGSTYTKYCIMDSSRGIVDLFSEKTPIRQKEYFDEKCTELIERYSKAEIISCGYGKRNARASRSINELTALAKGSNFIAPKSSIILDIGGQDTKIICQENGSLEKFFINDKCAAGSGRFLANIAQLLEIDFGTIDLTGVESPRIKLSSVCAVFAQSEIVELIASNTPGDVILQAVIWHILIQAKALTGKVKESAILLSGGLTQIKGIKSFAERVFERKCCIPKSGMYLSAIGCSLFCV